MNSQFTKGLRLDWSRYKPRPMVLEYRNYRAFLRSVLSDRKGKNALYSQRAFARSLRLSPSLLSSVLAGTKNLSFETAIQVAEALGLNPDESDYFASLVQLGSLDCGPARELVERKLEGMRGRAGAKNLGVDAFRLISEWYHLPILQMCDLDPASFRFEPARIAARLGISTVEAEAAVERLLRLELIELGEDGRYRRVHENLLIESTPPNAALRIYHTQMLARAEVVLETQDARERFTGSEAMAFDPAQVPEASRRIDEFLTSLAEFARTGPCKTEVYLLGAQLFRLTQPSKGVTS